MEELNNRGTAEICKVSIREENLYIYWKDGHTSQFPFYWLRLNCQSRLPSLQKKQGPDYGLIPKDIRPWRAEIYPEGQLVIHWEQEDHTSVFTASWLRDHELSDEPSTNLQPLYTNRDKAS